ncbi:hypothetical protein C8J23_1322 [Shewanella chilikensis]|uniref:Transposase n=1 Tax=Shewanella chilikensis TaxID=558541 RepID=A0ABX5PJK4_9GAMM|nr:hypothetical protein C8J23_1322 [Shewanella chilikensis]
MTTARRQLIDAESTPFYHVINRCVRNSNTGQPYLLMFRPGLTRL